MHHRGAGLGHRVQSDSEGQVPEDRAHEREEVRSCLVHYAWVPLQHGVNLYFPALFMSVLDFSQWLHLTFDHGADRVAHAFVLDPSDQSFRIVLGNAEQEIVSEAIPEPVEVADRGCELRIQRANCFGHRQLVFEPRPVPVDRVGAVQLASGRELKEHFDPDVSPEHYAEVVRLAQNGCDLIEVEVVE